MPSALERIHEVARKDRKQRFTALLHHVYDVERLRAAYFATRRDAAAGIDGETWRHYGGALEDNLRDLSARLKRGAYRAKPVRRAFIPKADGQQRPLGVPTLEDKIVQRAVVEVLNAIYETDFVGFSYGFRPKRSQHQALDALTVGIKTKKVNWVVDADIRSFFDTLKHEWLVKFVEHRIGDRRLVRLIQKWLSAGVLEDGERTVSEVGTVQGGSISPLLANIYLHYVFDLWILAWRRTRARGDVVVVRYADDFVAGFEHKSDAEQFLAELRERFSKFNLELHPRQDAHARVRPPCGRKPGRPWRGEAEDLQLPRLHALLREDEERRFNVLRKTMATRMAAKLAEVTEKLRKRRHTPVPEQGAYLKAVVQGHARYYGVPLNSHSVGSFRHQVGMAWWRSLNRRSQRGKVPAARMAKHLARWLPQVRVCHPWPEQRLRVRT
ncbi:MAG: group II intron reverse transcriptase/maturase [Thermoleophilia bacterium]|nr:group II intron reverse transcriptase/maturase [Thermoleophilia bacterium]